MKCIKIITIAMCNAFNAFKENKAQLNIKRFDSKICLKKCAIKHRKKKTQTFQIKQKKVMLLNQRKDIWIGT